jgi:5-methylcytosine-specific restriction endonuclease McrA
MHKYWLSHLSDGALSRELAALVSRDRATTAELLAHVAEFDLRRLYAPAGYSSMHAYCVGELRLSEDAAMKRLQAARLARGFPVIFGMVADGRLHLSAVCLLSHWLTHDNAKDLLAAATHRTKAEIEKLIAERFPRPDVPARVLPIAVPPAVLEPAPGQVDHAKPERTCDGAVAMPLALSVGVQESEPAPGQVESRVPVNPQPLLPPAPRPRVAPLAPARYSVQFTAGQGTHDLLRRAEDLLGHRLNSEEMDQIFALGLQELIAQLEKQKFAATDHPRAQRGPARGRHIPAEVKRRVQARDQGRCTYVSEHGRRCDARRFLEYDHIEPVARGGRSTVENPRLRCRAHNQYEAECAFGSGFMHEKRERARRAAVDRPPLGSAAATEPVPGAPTVRGWSPPATCAG